MGGLLKRILLVDDEPDIRSIACLSLEAVGGYSIKSCSNGDEAIEIVKDYTPELILLDVMMPGKDGPTVLSDLRQVDSLQKIPIVFLTARVHEQEVQEYMSVGAAGVISKPFDPMNLPARVGAIWDSL